MKLKTSTATPNVPVREATTSSEETDGSPRRLSFAFPILSAEDENDFSARLSVSPAVDLTQKTDGSSQVKKPIITTIKVVAVSSSRPGSPAFEANKFNQKPCHKFKARIFKCRQPRNSKVTSATSPTSSNEEDGSMHNNIDDTQETEDSLHTPESSTESTDSPKSRRFSFLKRRRVTDSPRRSIDSTESTESPRITDSPRFKRLPFIKRRSMPKSPLRGSDVEGQLSGQSATESEIEELPGFKIESPSPPPPVTDGGKKVSRSQELKVAFRNFKKRYKSQEILPTSEEDSQLGLDMATVEELDELAFPFNHQKKADKKSTPKSNLVPKLTKCKSDKSVDKSLVLSSSTVVATGTNLNKSLSSCLPRTSSAEKSTFIDHRLPLRKVKTLVATPAAAEAPVGSSLLDSEISGTFLVLAVLGFLLVGKIPAILGTACLCLVISRVQKLRAYSMTSRQREEIVASRRAATGLSRLGGTSPPHNSYGGGDGSPAFIDVNSRDYRKKVVMDGFLDRGNRKVA
ncbi:hypothetical protein R1flu_023183 [Riccia fluitans]|uniref:Uncharacterized protein n=1 Tax=Riccia fluitans TaxID=41844 RepID=A0ABD1XU93_9MARC